MNHDHLTQQILGPNAIDHAVAYSTEVVGKECVGCMRALPYSQFDRDASYRDGRKDLCTNCASSPRLSTDEHTARLRETNFNSEFVRRQRWAHQDDYRGAAARIGRAMRHSDFLLIIQKLIPSLYITPGRIVGDLAVFRT